jgi:ABC-type multidrug transport system fused ATPase/permease subunit
MTARPPRIGPGTRAHVARFRDVRGLAALGTLVSVVHTLLLIPIPVLVAVAIDDALEQDDTGLLLVAAAAILGLTLVGAGIGYLGKRITLAATKRVTVRLRMDLLERLYGSSRQYALTHDVTDFHDRATTQVDRADQAVGLLLTGFIPNIALSIGMLALLVTIDPVLTVVTLALGGGYIVVNRRLITRLLPRIDAYQDEVARVSAGVWASLRGQELARLQGAEQVDLTARRAEQEAWRAAAVRRGLANTTYHVWQQAMLASIGAGILLVGGLLVAEERLTIGDLLAFYAGFALLRGPLGSTSGDLPFLFDGVTAMERIHELWQTIDEHPYRGTAAHDLAGRFELRDVTVDYGRGPVLQDVSLVIPAGSSTALVGPNGSGKSTLVGLLLGGHRPDVGEVLVDGRPYDELDVRGLVRQMGIVAQEPAFFAGSIRDNLRYGTDADDDELRHALALATADEFVTALPEGIDTEIGDDGVLLSGGQRQRLAIARALVRRPRVLVLDEPTNHLDEASIDGVLRNLRSLPQRPTVLLVTHLHTVLHAVDTTIRLDAGRIVEQRGAA